jgi:hypothetical protein
MDLSMADDVISWVSESLPNEDHLWMRVHKVQWSNGDIAPGAFRNLPTPADGMSTDWAKYSTADDTRNRARIPKDNAVIQLEIEKVRQLPDQTVVHTPDLTKQNRAHTDVFGEKTPEVRIMLKRLAQTVIPL